MSFEYDRESRPGSDEELIIPVSLGGEITMTLTRGNTIVRRFEQGEGVYDHCMVLDDYGDVRVFQPSTEILEMLEEHNFPVRTDDEVDEPTIEFFVALQKHELDTALDD